MDAKSLAAKLGGKPTTKGFMCRCPAHEDKRASLWIFDKEDGDIYVQCKTGNCDFRVIRQLLELDTPNGSNGKPHISYSTNGDFTPVNICYEYKDELGKVVFVKERPNRGGSKFINKQPDGKGGFIHNLNGIEKKPLYNLPAILNAIKEGKPVAILEGEKDCETFTGVTGIPATTNFEGGGTWKDEYSLTLKGANIILCYDTDATGIKHKNAIKDSLLRLADPAALTIYHLPTELNGVFIKDFTDYIDNGGGSSLNGIRIENVKGSIEDKTCPYTATSVFNFLSKEYPPKEHIIGPFVKQGLSMVFAKAGVGKTHFALGIAYAISSKGSFLSWKCEIPQSVIYFDGELPAHVLTERLKRLNPDKKDIPFYLVTPDEQKLPMPDLSSPEGQQIANQLIGDTEFIVIDNVSTLFRSIKENEADSWTPVQSWLLNLRTKGKSVLLVHHEGKGDTKQRGSSKMTDVLDLVIQLKHPSGFTGEDGCEFEISYPKSRHFRKGDINKMTAKMTDFGWEVKTMEASLQEEMVRLRDEENLSFEKIGKKLGVTKHKVMRTLQKIDDEKAAENAF